MPAEGIGRVTAAAKAPSNGSGAGPSTEPAAADGTATPLPLLTRYSLRLMTFVVDAVPVVPPRSTSPDVAALEQKSASCRLLLSLFVLDAINWVCYKLFQFLSVDEFARLAFLEQSEVSFPLSVVQFGVLMVVMDSTMEFVGMLLMPRIYSWVEGTHEYSTAKLAIFCLRCYLLALAVALVVGLVLTPCILDGPTKEFSWAGLAMGRRVMTTCKSKTCGCADASDDGHFACAGNPSAAQWLENTRGESCCYFNTSSGNATVSPASLMYVCPAQESNMCFLQPAALAWVLAAVRWIFYGFVNQLSDCAREVGKTQWLKTFETTDGGERVLLTTELRFPGCFPSSMGGGDAAEHGGGPLGRAWAWLGRHACIRRPAKSLSLSVYLTMLNITVKALFSGAWFLVKGSNTLRFVIVVIPGLIGTVASSALLHSALSRRTSTALLGGIWGYGEVIPDAQARESVSRSSGGDASMLWPSQLLRREVAIVLFLMVVRGLQTQAEEIISNFVQSDGLETMMVAAVESSNPGASSAWVTWFQNIVIVLFIVLVIVYMLFKVIKLPWENETLLSIRETAWGPGSSAESLGSGSLRSPSGVDAVQLGISSRAASVDPRASVEPPPPPAAPPPAAAEPSRTKNGKKKRKQDIKKQIKSWCSEPAEQAADFGHWVRLLWTILALLLVSGLLLAIEELVKRGRPDNTSPISPTVTLVITVFGLVAYLPLFPINKTMDFLNDAFLIGYDNSRSPSVMYYGNLMQTVVAWILLLVVTFALSSDTFFAPPPEQASCGDVANVDDDRYQLGIVVIITGGLMGFAATCFSVLYWCFRFDPLKDHTPPRELTVKGTSYA